MTTRLLALLALLLPSLAAATTWTCTRDFTAVQPGYYEAVGTCTGSGAYATSGGNPLGASATSSATAQALCGSGAQVLVDLMTSSSADGAVALTALCGFDHTSFKYVCSTTPATPGTATGFVQISGTVVPPPFRYRAVCK